jgi:hypothetical protein
VLHLTVSRTVANPTMGQKKANHVPKPRGLCRKPSLHRVQGQKQTCSGSVNLIVNGFSATNSVPEAGLVDGEDDSPILVPGNVVQDLDYVKGAGRVQPGGRLVQEPGQARGLSRWVKERVQLGGLKKDGHAERLVEALS